MGKKARRTRWRTLTIDDDHSDSEESSTTNSGHRVSSKGHPQKAYYTRFNTYSSQSTPIRKYDGGKSTRSSSTASENKITFNEDEYTRITTPRQDVLFKKGYLNKPKTYQTQTSTGNSTTSTGNSTGNGTPDHQSTDLEYESQFVFPNGFVDQNGIYYVNSFEPYPLMVFNPPTYYQEFSNSKAKRHSTDSLTESTSPNNEEVAAATTTVPPPPVSSSDTNQPCNEEENVDDNNINQVGVTQQDTVDVEPRRPKKRRRRRPSRSQSPATSYSGDSSDEVFTDDAPDDESAKVDAQELLLKSLTNKENATMKKSDLKPDAEEFVPRAYRQPVEFIKVAATAAPPANFVPIPMLNPCDYNGTAFIPPGIPINFVQPNYVNFLPPNFTEELVHEEETEDEEEYEDEAPPAPPVVVVVKETVEVPITNNNNNNKNSIDIAKIVSKLEEAVKEQVEETAAKEQHSDNINNKPRRPRRNRFHSFKPLDEVRHKPAWKQQHTTGSPAKEFAQLTETAKKIVAKNPPMVDVTKRNFVQNRNSDKVRFNNANKKPGDESPVKNQKIVQESPVKSMPNQWIPVSSRKKRKNKNNVEEVEEVIEEIDKDKDLFESYDVNLLEDVVVATSDKTERIEVVVDEIPIVVVEEVEEKATPMKKSKKNCQKPPTKRVIIKDIDLSIETSAVKSAAEPVDTPPVLPIVEEKIEEAPTAQVVEESKTKPKKKKNKKKTAKSTVAAPINTSLSSSNTTLNLPDDSQYDFLLETSILDESMDKTNLEVSQELDKMIQKGMYSNLEEKIKSLNIESNDNFFKTIINNISSTSRESSVEKNSYIKTPDFSKIITNTPTIKAPALGDLSINNKSGFLDEAASDLVKNDNLYPITKAVKDWMTKTRETTPDVEILKSPSTILKEFGGDEEEEVTLYSFSREDSVDNIEGGVVDDEEVEIYESKYGQNEDYLKIKAEVEDKKSNYPKHGNLPYRAICCSIM